MRDGRRTIRGAMAAFCFPAVRVSVVSLTLRVRSLDDAKLAICKLGNLRIAIQRWSLALQDKQHTWKVLVNFTIVLNDTQSPPNSRQLKFVFDRW